MPVIRRVKKSQVSSTKTATPVKTKTPAVGRATQKKTASSAKSAPRKSTRGSAKVTTVAKPTASTKAVRDRQVDPVTGFGVGTDSDVMIKEAMKGGNTRPEVIGRVKDKLPKKTESGSDKPVANVFASVLKKKLDQGFYIESSWVLRPPTAASKRKATMARKAAEGDNVTSITTPTKKTATRKRRAA